MSQLKSIVTYLILFILVTFALYILFKKETKIITTPETKIIQSFELLPTDNTPWKE